MAKVLVVGGAGYVGGATCAYLLDQGHQVLVIDDLSTGHTQGILGAKFLKARIGDRARVLPFLQAEKPDCVMHFAAKSLVAESVAKPALYQENNVDQTRVLLEMMLEAGVRHLVFSSTCAIFGDPGDQRIHEGLTKNPMNPYGQTKLQAEGLMQDFAKKGIHTVALRYFNAAGAEPGLRTGEWHEPESHLIPNIFRAMMANRPVSVFGTDYKTRDGTCVRDYIHVSDLARAHEQAVHRMMKKSGSEGSFEAFNLGSESGFTVLEVIREVEKVVGKKVQTRMEPRRAGDPPQLVADSTLAKKELGFSVGSDSLTRIISSAWAWEKKRTGKQKAVFLDRDGTLNPDPGYISSPEQIRLLPHVGEALKKLHSAGFHLIVVSNQSGVGRGLIHKDAIYAIHDRLDEYLAASGVQIDRYELCFHRPDDHCRCRKPGTQLILDGAEALNIDIGSSYFVGDKVVDFTAGMNAGCKAAILVRTGEGVDTEQRVSKMRSDDPNPRPSQVVDSVREAADWILTQET
ncbi:MAG: UDP-glucose 4-epimerase GalE [Bdellovibrionales bacterium]|nr:UDP-glucose 4-epimerase GalE [Bdellovibrionales bacterium]